MTSTVDPISLPQRAASSDTEIDRAALANLLVEIARNVDPDYRARLEGVPTADPRMETLRQLLVGREISELSRVAHLLDEPEQLASAVGGVLPSAAARAPHAQLGEALAPAVERAVQRSIQKSPRTLTDILYPVFLPAIRKSIGEKIDQTFQSLNETLRHIFTWHGLKWRVEAWRTGASFPEVVLKHSLVYRVEHVFLINRNSGILIAHVTADNATSEDPQLISSMLSAIQDFVKDSFNEKEQSGLDTIRFGELRLWSEVGPFATLVAVIRGNPPEELHEIVRDVLFRIHDEYSQALEQFDGDSSQLPGIETQLHSCVELKQEDSNQGFPWLVVAAILLVLIPAGGWFFLSWQSGQRWQAYVSRLSTQPGIIVAEQKVRDGQFHIAGLRDPLAADPQALLTGTQVDPARVHSQWQFYQSLEPEFVLKRLTTSLAPPKSVRLSIVEDRIVAEGEAPDTWIDRARAAARQLEAGGPVFDISKVRDVSPEARAAEHWQAYVSRLEAQPGIIVAQQTARGGHFYISGLRDPQAADPQALLSGTGVDPARVHSQWQFYQSLEPEFVLKRLVASLTPPKSVRLSIVNDRIVAEGEAPDTWIDRARAAARQLSAGGPVFDISRVRDVSPEARAAEHWQAYVSRLSTQPGIIVAEQKVRDGQFYIAGLRDPLAADPQALLTGTQIDPARVHSQWQFYQSLDPKFVLKRLTASLTPPKSVRLSIVEDRIVAEGEAPDTWIDRARAAARQLSAGGPVFDISKVRDVSPEARAAEHWQHYVSRLEAQPGIIVAQQSARGGHFYISGLRDPQAADPQALLSGTGVDPARVHSHWQFYQSLDPKFVVKRLMASLTPPDSVRFSIIKDRIVVVGEAPAAWIDRARVAAQQLAADGLSLEISELRELTPQKLTHLREAIQAVDIFFDSGKAIPGPAQLPVLDKLANQLKELAKDARKAGVTAQFMLTGHSDATGRETANVSISAARAETVRALLKKRGVDPELLLVRGAGTFEPAETENSRTGSSANRRVSVTVNFH
ncbi:MAG: OmpA family protein [Mesorhizobium sp.]|uniref:OmpA family protein n=1 Tax=Mesorhizobium sp. TaxID=1871066 RepID=UPI000FE495A5|nr:OmpA family protein [Mesorhizobium sp.]RWH70336.1 MAG: OmpA family protein [Mesorhizobium sp.]RWH91604.1 MAG: OmpA family protein [Mesorhizobium sp.]RWI03752.1 MAG: OmpA family protein [Mesorhizobium sp.]RWM30418.1 MAG: OmpA family protein [Mesorhizobium sp.]RWM63576.1 MAG: OmpA family protein [Mesorhizobium sp.]